MTDQMQSWFDDDALTVPAPIRSPKHPNGKVYKVASPSFETGLKLQRLGSIAQRISAGVEVPESEAAKLKFDDDEEIELAALVLGDTLTEMREDGVLWGSIKRVLSYAFTYYAVSPEAAERLIAPKAQEPTNRAARRKKAKKASTGAR